MGRLDHCSGTAGLGWRGRHLCGSCGKQALCWVGLSKCCQASCFFRLSRQSGKPWDHLLNKPLPFNDIFLKIFEDSPLWSDSLPARTHSAQLSTNFRDAESSRLMLVKMPSVTPTQQQQQQPFAIERSASVLCTSRAITAVALSKFKLSDSETVSRQRNWSRSNSLKASQASARRTLCTARRFTCGSLWYL